MIEGSGMAIVVRLVQGNGAIDVEGSLRVHWNAEDN